MPSLALIPSLLLIPSFVSSQDPYPSYNAYTSKAQIHHASQFHTPPGYYSSDSGVTLTQCPQGFYCPKDSASPIACGNQGVFCPLGSAGPTVAEKGHYTITAVEDGYGLPASTNYNHDEVLCPPGSYCKLGIKYPCSAGFHGATFGSTDSSCDGQCDAGYFCPPASISPQEVPCGDPGSYCPPGSSLPTSVSPGYFSIGGSTTTRTGETIATKGSYAVSGVLYTCPASRFGSREGETDPQCEGWCLPGFYCPPGSTTAGQIMCGDPGRFCPERSAAPLLTWEGYYTTEWDEPCRPGRWRNTTNVVDPTLSPTLETSTTQTSVPLADCDLCPVGKFKSVRGDDKALCVNCPIQQYGNGDFGRKSSEDRTTCECERLDGGAEFDFLWFNETSAECVSVSKGFVGPHSAAKRDDSQRVKPEQMECERGHYCVGGLKYQCPAGYYGDQLRETRTTCAGKCSAGYYCPLGSSSPTEFKCGTANEFDGAPSASLICPEGSSKPVRVTAGYYSNEEVSETTRSYQIECPPGYYCVGAKRYECFPGYFGSSTKNTAGECDGLCEFGHYCPIGSVKNKQIECGGSNVYCPTGSALPTVVSTGYYTVPGQIDLEIRNVRDVSNRTMSKQTPCLPGHFCEDGVIYQCPEGTWGHIYGMRERSDCRVCEEGYYCPSYPMPPSTKGDQIECGSVDLFCPLGSSKPTNVTLGYYTIGGDERNTTRITEVQCEEGYYCAAGVKRACPAGTYGETKGLTDKKCSGFCPAGSMCPVASTAPIECGVNEYSTASAFECVSCGVHSVADASGGSGRCKNSRKCCSQ
jgi:hypothetical protein